MEYKVEYVKRKIKPGNYIGMNAKAANQLHIQFKHKHPEHTILIYSKSPKDVRIATEHHEMAERYFASILHMGRKKSHYNALRFENFNIPFPKHDIKRKLKEVHFKIL